MKTLNHLTIREIEKKLENNEFPFSGITQHGSIEFHFLQPSFYAGVAMHAGHLVRSGLDNIMLATKQDRFREEDPYTERFIEKFPIQIIGLDSRFEYDLNRKARRAICDHEEKIWGIQVWKKELDREERNLSLIKHQEFHDLMDVVVEYLNRQNRYSVIFDMHSYCYRREGTKSWHDNPWPEINIGTRAVNRNVFGRVIKDFKRHLSNVRIDGYPVRLAENEIFSGGYLAKRLSKAYPDRLLVLALEYKKIFMDEVTGELYNREFEVLIQCFDRAVQKIVESGFFD